MMGKIKKRAAAVAGADVAVAVASAGADVAVAGADAVVADLSAAPGVATEAAPELPAGRAFAAEAVILA